MTARPTITLDRYLALVDRNIELQEALKSLLACRTFQSGATCGWCEEYGLGGEMTDALAAARAVLKGKSE